MVERLMPQETSIRAHHLQLVGEFVFAFSEEFPGEKPWTIGDNEGKVKDFISNFARIDAEKDLRDRQNFESISPTDRTLEKDLRYLYDLIGSDENDFRKVVIGRIEYFTEIFNIAGQSQDERILISTKEDGFCRSCAVGNHCKRPRLQEILKNDRDFEYLHYLSKFPNVGLSKVHGQFYITAELLFDNSFYTFLGRERVKAIDDVWQIR